MPRIADRAEENRVERPKQVQRLFRHHPAVIEVVLRPPRKVLPLEAEAGAPGGRVEDSKGGGDDFLSDPVAGNDGNAICLHAHHSPRTFHQRKPIGSQITRCASDTMNPMRHHAGCET